MIIREIYEMTQEELIDYIIDTLDKKGIQYKVFSDNIWSITHIGAPTFVAHMDTVAFTDSEYKMPVYEWNDILFKTNTILGADDRAGVNLILNHIEDINFIFTVDEESGRLGAKDLTRSIDFINDVDNTCGFIELDRKGDSDVLGAKHGYCRTDFVTEILEVLDGHTDAKGVYTDIDEFIKYKPGVNVSVGYYNAHSDSEYLDLKYWKELDDKIMELANIRGEFLLPEVKVYKTKYPRYSSGYWQNLYYEDKDSDVCECCGLSFNKNDLIEVNGIKICDECYEDLLTLHPDIINK